jgi:hypothetical protein
MKTFTDQETGKTYVRRDEAADQLAADVKRLTDQLRALPDEFDNPEQRARLTQLVEQAIANIEPKVARSVARLRYGSVN